MLLPLVLLFISGAAALIYQVLWLKELGLLFGNTAQASSVTLTIFFLGISAGGWFFGEKTPKINRPLATYGWLEIGIAISAALYFLIYDVYFSLYDVIFNISESNTLILLLFKALLSTILLFPPAFFMGGTLPVLGQFIVKTENQLARRGALMYGVNTLGAVTGATLAGFMLPQVLGFKGAYITAMLLNIGVGIIAISSSQKHFSKVQSDDPTPPETAPGSQSRLPQLVTLIALASGILSLSLEVLWTRMFAQLLQNSVYTYSLILSFFLLSLAFGSIAATRLAKLKVHTHIVLATLLILTALSVSLTPSMFTYVSEFVRLKTATSGWYHYLGWVSGSLLAVIFIPGLLLGTLFPYLLKSLKTDMLSPGQNIGRLCAINTFGAIIGAAVSGFVIIPLMGLWAGIKLMAGCYAVLALFVIPKEKFSIYSAIPVLTALFIIFWVTPPGTNVTIKKEEKLLDLIEGSHATVAVINDKGNIRLKVNNSYTLGDTNDTIRQRLQTELAVMLHKDPKQVFHLGLGTGITAGASLNFPIEKVTVAELLPEVIDASRVYYKPYLNGLFNDPRVNVIAEDARNFLLGTNNTYDLIIGDLFLPWKAGTGSLYTENHFKTVKKRLRPNGLFVQWLPTYQFSRNEFNSIAKTLLGVFDYVTIWRATFFPFRPTIALVGHLDGTPIDMNNMLSNYRKLTPDATKLPDDFLSATIGMYYAGNLSLAPSLVQNAPLNTDDRPVIEYLAPLTEKQQAAGKGSFMTGEHVMTFLSALRHACPVASDPMLANLTPGQLNAIRAGDKLMTYKFLKKRDKEKASAFLEEFHSLIPPLLSQAIKSK